MKLTSKFSKHLTRNEILVPYLNNYFATANWPDNWQFTVHPNKEKDDAFHPSSALMCLKALWFKMEGYEFPEELKDFGQQKNFLFGHFYHTTLQWIMVEGLGFATWDDIEKEFDFHLETPKGNPYRVRGFVDIAKCVIPNTDPFLVDIKTMNARIYAQSPTPDFWVEKFEAQVRMYLDFTGLDKAVVLLVEKDSPHRFKELVIERDDLFVDQIVEGWESVVDARAEGIIPDCTCWDPGKCPVKDYDTKTTTIAQA